MDRTYEKYDDEYSPDDDEYSTDDDEYSTDEDENSTDGDEYEYDGGSSLYSKSDSSVSRTFLDKSHREYVQVLQLFQKTGSTKKFSLTVQCIEKITNLGLKKKFERKKEEYKQKYGKVEVVKVFHGTKSINIPSILKNNLDVQRHGQSVGHRFGAGVSFSRFSNYASHYCDKSHSGDQMLLCYVIISNIIEVKELRGRGVVLKEPPFIEGRYPLRYDTTAKNKHSMDVIVKFENDSFYPAYIIHFLKTEKLSTCPPGSLSVENSVSNISKTYTKDNAEEKQEVAPPSLEISADEPLRVPGFGPYPTSILNEPARTLKLIGAPVEQQISEPKPAVAPGHQESHLPKQVSRPKLYLLPRPPERIVPEQVSKPTPSVVSRSQQIIAPRPEAATAMDRCYQWVDTISGFGPYPTSILNPPARTLKSMDAPVKQQISEPKPSVAPRHQESHLPKQVSRPKPYLLPRPPERIAPKQVSKPTPPVVSRPQQIIAPRPEAATAMDRCYQWVHTTSAIDQWVPTLSTPEAPCPSERTATEDQQSKFISSLQFFFRKICCCLGDKKQKLNETSYD